MKYLKNPRFWISAAVILMIPLTLVTIGFLGRSGDSENPVTSETTVPVATSSSTMTDNPTGAKPQPKEVTINTVKLANNYFIYEKSEYEKARTANRPILIFFYANWCPTCARQEPINVATFNSLTSSNVIAFRVNFNDSDTSPDEEALAEEFGVTYQHTFFTLDSSGEQVDKFLGDTSSEEIKGFLAKID